VEANSTGGQGSRRAVAPSDGWMDRWTVFFRDVVCFWNISMNTLHKKVMMMMMMMMMIIFTCRTKIGTVHNKDYERVLRVYNYYLDIFFEMVAIE
jgi:hypothetical protein